MTVSLPGILGLGGYVPERVMTNADWAQYVDTSDEWITERTGIKRRHIVDESQSTADVAIAAAEVAIDDAGLTAGDIDEVIVASDTPEVYCPDTAAFVQHRMGMREVTAFDLGGSGCAGWVLALDVARARASSTQRRILVIGVEVLTKLIDWTDRNTCVLFGDAAGAAVVGVAPDAVTILGATAGTDGSKNDILGLETGGTRVPFSLEGAQQGLHKNLVMDGRAVYKEAVRRMTQAARDVLSQADRSIDDVALVVPHQANLRIIETVRERLGLPEDRIFVNVQDYGNTGSASVPFALWQARGAGRVAEGDLVLLTAFGAGFHWAAALLQF